MRQFFANCGLISASLLIHGAALMSLEHGSSLFQTSFLEEQKILARQSAGNQLQFEFIEAPKKTHPARPARTKKVSNRDSLNQDSLPDKSKAGDLPAIKERGPSDQLAQLRAIPIPGQGPVPAQPAAGSGDEKKTPVQKNTPSQEPAPPQKQTPAAEEAKIQSAGSGTNKIEEDIVVKKEDVTGQNIPQIKEIPGLVSPGRDKITTQETARVQSTGAKLFGQTSFEATGSGMGVYMKNLKEKVWLSWFPYLSFQYPNDFRSADAVISFVLDAKGQVKSVQIVESEGSFVFASYCARAIQQASNFGDLPKELLAITGKDELEIKFGFHYR